MRLNGRRRTYGLLALSLLTAFPLVAQQAASKSAPTAAGVRFMINGTEVLKVAGDADTDVRKGQ